MATSRDRFWKLIQHFSMSRQSILSSYFKASIVRQFRSAADGSSFNAGGDAPRRRTSHHNRDEDNPPPPPLDALPNRALRGHRKLDHSPRNNRSSFRQERMSNDDVHGMNFNNGDRAPRRSPRHINGEDDSNHPLPPPQSNFRRERMRSDISDDSFLEKFKLSFDKGDKLQHNAAAAATAAAPAMPSTQEGGIKLNKANMPPPPPEDADEIFKKMKETGMIPNAVAMLDGLCKDGLSKEAMELFGSMREKGTIPEVVVYTAVVEGFCKAHKVDDAKRIFRKMQDHGIVPNAFSYAVLVQGLYKCSKLEDAAKYCEEMIDAGHSPNVPTFVGLVNGFCKEKGVEEGKNVIKRLREKGFIINEKAVREFLDKKAPFSPALWEAILGKKPSDKLF